MMRSVRSTSCWESCDLICPSGLVQSIGIDFNDISSHIATPVCQYARLVYWARLNDTQPKTGFLAKTMAFPKATIAPHNSISSMYYIVKRIFSLGLTACSTKLRMPECLRRQREMANSGTEVSLLTLETPFYADPARNVVAPVTGEHSFSPTAVLGIIL